jgi:hypothetical protein
VDATAPEAPSITAPADNSLSNTGSFTFSGTAEANSTVELFEGTTSKTLVAKSRAADQAEVRLGAKSPSFNGRMQREYELTSHDAGRGRCPRIYEPP